MKRVFTEKRKANRGPSKTAGWIYSMSVAERRARNILASDSADFDKKHGMTFQNAVNARKAEMASSKRQNIRRTN